MTRQEKKEELIGLFLNGAITIGELIDECFEFVQHHPRWISVEDELPPYSQQVLAYSEYNPWAEMWWSERNKEYDAKFGKSGEYLILHDSNGFETLRDDGNKPIQVTHWMRIEPPAVLSSLESTEKKLEEKKGGEQ